MLQVCLQPLTVTFELIGLRWQKPHPAPKCAFSAFQTRPIGSNSGCVFTTLFTHVHRQVWNDGSVSSAVSNEGKQQSIHFTLSRRETASTYRNQSFLRNPVKRWGLPSLQMQYAEIKHRWKKLTNKVFFVFFFLLKIQNSKTFFCFLNKVM